MIKRKYTVLLQLLVAQSLFYVATLRADVSTLDVAQQNVAACQDYFTSEWATPLDMNEPEDILNNLVPREVQQLSNFNFSNGIFSTTSTGNDPYFRLLTWVDNSQGQPVAIPDSTTRYGYNKPLEFARQGYKTLSFRMYSNVASAYQVLYDKKEGGFGITDPSSTYPGWHTYTIDLQAKGLHDTPWATGEVTGLRIDPVMFTAAIGAEIKFDWIQLTKDPANCSTNIVANYSTSNSDFTNVILDTNTDVNDGIIEDSGIQTAASGNTTFQTGKLFPGTYSLYALASKDFATLNTVPWDMDDGATDVDSGRIYNITKSDSGFSGGKFCGQSTTNDPNFWLKFPKNKTLNANVFNKFSIRIASSVATTLDIHYFDSNQSGMGAIGGTSVSGDGNYHTINVDLSSAPGWSGDVAYLRIDPINSSGRGFCVDWIAIGSTFASTEPTLPTVFPSARNPTVDDRPVVKFVQPDREGAEDFFVNVRGKPSDMSSTSDIQHADNLTEAWIYPGNVYTDSGGAVKSGDYFEAISKDGSDDPTNFSVFLDNNRTIDPEKYKIACFTLDVLAPTNIYHSVARILWQRDTQNVNGDDIVLKTTGESRYCYRMENLQTEPYSDPANHPWRKNSDGTGINYWRIDAHEENTPTSFRIQDIRLAADHRADDKFLIVLDGYRDRNVELYYSGRGDGTQGTLITTITAGRNTDTYLWNTSGIANGTWFLYLKVGTEVFTAPGPVIISHQGNPDSTAPVLGVDAPLSGHNFTDSLEIAGHAVDNLKIATLEAFIDGQLISTFRPSQFRKNIRDAYPSWPASGDSGFQLDVSVPGSIGLGNHLFTLKAYDTMGNLTEYKDISITRVGSNPTARKSYPVPNEGRSAVSIVQPAQPPAPTPSTPVAGNLQLVATVGSVKVKKVVSPVININVTNASGCSSVEVLANIAPNKDKTKLISKKPALIYRGAATGGVVNLRGQNLKYLKAQPKGVDTKVYLIARCDGARDSPIVKLDAKKVKKSKFGMIANMKSFLGHVRSKAKPG